MVDRNKNIFLRTIFLSLTIFTLSVFSFSGAPSYASVGGHDDDHGESHYVCSEERSFGASFDTHHDEHDECDGDDDDHELPPPPTPVAPSVTLAATPASLTLGDSTTLSWTATDATTCSASWTTSTATTGIVSVTPTADATYAITCTGPGGSATASTTVTVLPVPPAPPESFPFSVLFSGTGSGTATSTPSGIACPGTCFTTYASGTAVTLDAVASSTTSIFSGWTSGTGSAAACTGTGACSFILTATSTITALFDLIPPPPTPVAPSVTTTSSGSSGGGGGGSSGGSGTLGSSMAVSVRGNGSGTITIAPAHILCPEVCSTIFVNGTNIAITALPSSDSVFSGWTSGTGSAAACTGTGACNFLILESSMIVAVFDHANTSIPESKNTPLFSVPLVAPVSAETQTSCNYLRDYLRIGKKNNPVEVAKLQAFLIQYEGSPDLKVTGFFDQTTPMLRRDFRRDMRMMF